MSHKVWITEAVKKALIVLYSNKMKVNAAF